MRGALLAATMGSLLLDPATAQTVAKGGLCGGMPMPGRPYLRCQAELECVKHGGPMVPSDGPGRCVPKCKTFRDSWGNCVPGGANYGRSGCRVWFDGCNTCKVVMDRSRRGGHLAQCGSKRCYKSSGKAQCKSKGGAAPPPPSREPSPPPLPPPVPPGGACVSGSTCESLASKYGGWQSGGKQATAKCGESDNGFAKGAQSGQLGNQCWGGDDTATNGWQGAQSICFEVGARLCTAAELKDGVALGSGCGHDNSRVWSSTPCNSHGVSGHQVYSQVAGIGSMTVCPRSVLFGWPPHIMLTGMYARPIFDRNGCDLCDLWARHKSTKVNTAAGWGRPAPRTRRPMPCVAAPTRRP
jgi:hypothetical protein